MREGSVKGLTKRGEALVKKLREEKNEIEVLERKINDNTDDTTRCFNIINKNKIVGHVMVDISQLFKVATTSIHEQDAIQEEIDHILLENGLLF